MQMVYRGYVRLTFPFGPTAYRSHSRATYRTADSGFTVLLCEGAWPVTSPLLSRNLLHASHGAKSSARELRILCSNARAKQ